MAILRRKVVSSHEYNNTELLPSLTTPDTAVRFAKNMGVNMIPFDIENFIHILGISLNKIIMENDISGMLEKTNDGLWRISINSLHHRKRQRFTMAHELGHYFLHRSRYNLFTDKALYRSSNMTSMEYEANNFAGALLMPKDNLVSFFNDGEIDIEKIADHFDVSALAAKIRVEIIKRGFYAY